MHDYSKEVKESILRSVSLAQRNLYSQDLHHLAKVFLQIKQRFKLLINLFFIYLKSSKTQTSAAPLLLEKGAEVKMKLQDLKLLIDKKH